MIFGLVCASFSLIKIMSQFLIAISYNYFMNKNWYPSYSVQPGVALSQWSRSVISLVLIISLFLSVLIATKVTISKIYHLIRLRFERSKHKKPQCLVIAGLIYKYFSYFWSNVWLFIQQKTNAKGGEGNCVCLDSLVVVVPVLYTVDL